MVLSRTSVDLAAPPDDPTALAEFPSLGLESDEPLWQAAQAGNGPWWFDSSEYGRFNLPEPAGTCYLARDQIAAVLELVGPDRDGGVVSREFLEGRRLRRLFSPRELSLADLHARESAKFGVTLEICRVVPYDLPRSWALTLRHSGAEGLCYLVRHAPSAREGIALFGQAGERTSWRRGRQLEISKEVIEKMANETGITVAPIPRSDQLRVIA